MSATSVEPDVDGQEPEEEDSWPVDYVGTTPRKPVAVIEDDVIDAERLILDGVNLFDSKGVEKSPRFSVGMVSQFFFARNAHWLRWLEKENMLVWSETPGADPVPLLPERSQANARTYDLVMVEKMAHGLAAQGRISTEQLTQTLRLVKTQAEMHGLLTPNGLVFVDVVPDHHKVKVGEFKGKVTGETYPVDPLDDDMSHAGPTFDTEQVASLFFARSRSWLVKLEPVVMVASSLYREPSFMIHAEDAIPRVKMYGKMNRVYDLSLIERLAHGLRDGGLIKEVRFNRCIETVTLQARLYSMVEQPNYLRDER